MTRLRRTARALGLDWPADQGHADFVRALDPSRPADAAMVVAATTLLRGAAYTALDGEPLPDQLQHAALASSYAHVTAPLRRLVDRYGLEVCAALSAGEPVPEWARAALPQLPGEMQASGRRAGAYERGVLDLVEALTLRDRVGEQFDAVVLEAQEGDGRAKGTVMLREPGSRPRCARSGPCRWGRTHGSRCARRTPPRVGSASSSSPPAGPRPGLLRQGRCPGRRWTPCPGPHESGTSASTAAGRSTEKTLPRPSWDSTSMTPPWRSTMRLTMTRPRTVPGCSTASGLVERKELGEQLGAVLLGDADALVADPQADPVAEELGLQVDPASAAGVLHRVAHQVEHDLVQVVGLAQDERRPVARDRELEALGLRRDGRHRHGVGDEAGEVDHAGGTAGGPRPRGAAAAGPR